MNIGEKVKQLRQQRGLSQNELAKRSKISQPNLCRLEGGVSHTVRADNLFRIAAVLGVPADFFNGDAELTPRDIVIHDPEARELLRGYLMANAEDRRLLSRLAQQLGEKKP